MDIVSYYSLTYLQSDLDAFFRNFSPSLVGQSPKLVSIDGGKASFYCTLTGSHLLPGTIAVDEETDVGEDGWILQYLMTLTQGQPVTMLQVGNSQTGKIPKLLLYLLSS